MRTADSADVYSLAAKVQPELLRLLAALPKPRQADVLEFARSLGQFAEVEGPVGMKAQARIALRLAPADTLLRLTGLVTLGGDALVDAEALYDDNGRH